MENINKIYIINLDSRKDRWVECVKQLTKYNITNYERFSAIKPDISKISKSLYAKFSSHAKHVIIGASGCKLSHLNILKQAKTKNINNILILEDDFLLCNNFINKYTELMKNIEKHNITFNMLYLGISIDKSFQKINTPISNLKEIKNTYSTHAYIVNNKFYDIIIQEIENSQMEIDRCYMDVQSKYPNIYGVYPCFVSQMASFSDICNKNVNYSSIPLDKTN